MPDENEYVHLLRNLYEKTLILQDTTQFHPVLWFYLVDSFAHLDYTLGLYAFNYQSPKNIMTGEYLRWRIDEEKKGPRARFPAFITWLKETHPEKFESLPVLWKLIYDKDSPAGYRSFRIVLDPDSRAPLPPEFFFSAINEFFRPEFLKSLYTDASLAQLFETFLRENPEQPRT
ncbi:MAG: hypothetical protein ABFC24_04240 [Methanoregulaceae archaeon]